MREEGDIWLGDLLRCARRLGPLDGAQQATVARLLGFTWLAAPDATGAQPKLVMPDVTSAEPAVAIPPDTPAPPLVDVAFNAPHDDPPPDDVRSPQRRRRLEPVARHAGAGAATTPWQSHEPLPQYAPKSHAEPLPHEPLWEPCWTRALLAAALSTPTVGERLDVARAVDTIAHARPLTALPRIPGRTLARGVQVLTDTGEAMAPYTRDRHALAQQIMLVAGSQTKVLGFAGTPLRGAGPGGRTRWKPYEPPARGSPLVVLTDLGIGAPAAGSRDERHAEWIELARWLAARGSRLIALVPYPQRRWPRGLAGAITILHWDRSTTVSHVRARLIDAERR